MLNARTPRRTKLSLTIYLHFNGNCREVFEFYSSIFGGEFAIFETFRVVLTWACPKMSWTR